MPSNLYLLKSNCKDWRLLKDIFGLTIGHHRNLWILIFTRLKLFVRAFVLYIRDCCGTLGLE